MVQICSSTTETPAAEEPVAPPVRALPKRRPAPVPPPEPAGSIGDSVTVEEIRQEMQGVYSAVPGLLAAPGARSVWGEVCWTRRWLSRPGRPGPYLQALSLEAESLIRVSFLAVALWGERSRRWWVPGRSHSGPVPASGRLRTSSSAPSACCMPNSMSQPCCPHHPQPTSPRGFERGSLQSPAYSGPL